ncbi:MAG: protein kinase [Thermoanaerobaculia bacterium]
MIVGSHIGRFEVLGELGAGGMGRLYRARDPGLGRVVAIKVLAERLDQSPEHYSRFAQEARAASALNHPNIVTIHEVGEHEGYPFIAMELVLGRSLAARIEERFPSLRRLVAVAAQIAHGLAAAHEKGIVHRDLKPDNVMITPEGLVKILDFGLAKRTSGSETTLSGSQTSAEAVHVTEQGRLLGTVAYMSPEQARGLPLDFRSDQFAFGSILFEMLTGRRPFAGATTLDTLTTILHTEPAGIADLDAEFPAPLVWIVRRCLAKDPAARYAATRDLAHELETIRERMTDAGSLVGALAFPAQRLPRLRPATLGAGVACLLALVGAGLWYLRSSRDLPVADSAVRPASARSLRRIAVLPFRDLTGTPAGERIGEGFAETVSVRLAAASGLAVLPTAALEPDSGAPSTGGERGSSNSAQEIARRTGAEAVLRGALQFEGPTVRATFSILDALGQQISAGKAEGPAAQLLALQDEIATLAAAALGAAAALPTQSAPIEPRFAEDRYLEALGHLRRYENEASVDAAIRILDTLGESPEVAAARARAYLAQYELTQQREWAEKAIAASRLAMSTSASGGPGAAEAGARETLGRVEMLLGRPLAAAHELERALASQPNSVEARFALAEALQQLGRVAEAEATLRRAIALQPGWWATHHHLGVFLLVQGKVEESIPSLHEAIRLSPDNTRAIGNLGIAFQQLGRYEEAIAEYRRSIAIRPTAEALSNLATCEFVLERYSQATDNFRRAVAMQADSGALWRNLGDALRWAGGHEAETRTAYQKAIDLLEADLAVTPGDAEREADLAIAYGRTGRRDLARRHADRALELAPGDGYILYSVALVRLTTNDADPALDLLQRALAAGYPAEAVRTDPELDALRSNPRLAIMLAKPTAN